jgi:hypothetical protein
MEPGGVETMTTSVLIIYPENDFKFFFGPILRGGDESFSVDDATGTMTLLDSSGTPVTGANNLPMTAAGAGGMYSGTIAGSGFTPPVGLGYTMVVSLASATYGHGKWKLPAVVKDRTS